MSEDGDNADMLLHAEERIAELEAQLAAWKATAEQFKVSWGNECAELQRENAELHKAVEEVIRAYELPEEEYCGDLKPAIEALKSLRGGGK